MFAAQTAEILTYHQLPIAHITPKEGWVEQDPLHIVQAVIETVNVTCENLRKLNINPEDIVSVGITNQRETTVVWDSKTGKPLHNALGVYYKFFIQFTVVSMYCNSLLFCIVISLYGLGQSANLVFKLVSKFCVFTEVRKIELLNYYSTKYFICCFNSIDKILEILFHDF